jgi:hypothetical protein
MSSARDEFTRKANALAQSAPISPTTITQLISALSPSTPLAQQATSAASLLGATVSGDDLVALAALSRQISLEAVAAPPATRVLCRFSPPEQIVFEERETTTNDVGAHGVVKVTCSEPVLFKVKTVHPGRCRVTPTLHLLDASDSSVAVQIDVYHKHLEEFLSDVRRATQQFLFTQMPLSEGDAAAARARLEAGENRKTVLDPLWARVESELGARACAPVHNKLFAVMAPAEAATAGGATGATAVTARTAAAATEPGVRISSSGVAGGSNGGGGGGPAEAAPAVPPLWSGLQQPSPPPPLPAASATAPLSPAAWSRAADIAPLTAGGHRSPSVASVASELSALRQQYNENLQQLLVARADKDSQERSTAQLLVEVEVRRVQRSLHCTREYGAHLFCQSSAPPPFPPFFRPQRTVPPRASAYPQAAKKWLC